MSLKDLKNSGVFVIALLVAALVFVPFALEQIGEEFDVDFLKFGIKKSISGWFAPAKPSATAGKKVVTDPKTWDRYRKDLEEFTKWAEERTVVVVSLPTNDPVVIVWQEEKKTARQIWHVPVTSCTAGAVTRDGKRVEKRKGYVFLSGSSRRFEEGSIIEPTKDRCGYEIVNVGERAVWFRAIFDPAADAPMGPVRVPDFTRVDGQSLVRRNRKYVARDAFTFASGGCLMIDSFLPPDGVVFKIIDENYCEKASLLCVIIGEKGGK